MTKSEIEVRAMAYRMALPIPPEFDIRKSNIQMFIDWDTRRFVKTVSQIGQEFVDDPQYKALHDYYEASEQQANALWLQKYGEAMPDWIEGQWAETTPATAIPYEGLTTLTDAQWTFAVNVPPDFTLDEFWFVVEGLGWRPGVPVSEEDEKWIAVWAEESECSNYLQGVRNILGMSDAPYYQEPHWVPPAVARLINQSQTSKKTK
ncbi:hypothetical protein [Undibacterium oligocarboniphilum]|uniref:Uncharacterized protein n=1 Tax=Undibacterium oligocarboniphilum TaxID=666702 RepID=A0A850QIK0_9BURK|nr:hypothetical protein [Undibacterium oligocarboniphilum]MBC3871475.1 hypothetical protein [Undibacterium oligocarboniphilum]NVO78949.1 hypothetical protein [Undibacterium oligocarboniphilum]